MNRFAKIELVEVFEKVRYYSIRFEGDRIHEFEKFVSRFKRDESNLQDLNTILFWLRKIGNENGAIYKPGKQKNYFRHEGFGSDAKALPPTFIGGKLRLYCHVLNEAVVFLFNGGGPKLTKFAQDCPNVSRPFKLANRLAKSIKNAFKEGDIYWNEDYSDILFSKHYKIVI